MSYPKELRMVAYEDFATYNVYRFQNIHIGYDSLTVTELFRKRGDVERSNKWIK